mmetsp:Transcript_3132/g.8483  ORF Transcript_3132/g.8483 Transcript_3132/m.8483 type:complete len:83 (-) Transcript_3132:178-426(-)
MQTGHGFYDAKSCDDSLETANRARGHSTNLKQLSNNFGGYSVFRNMVAHEFFVLNHCCFFPDTQFLLPPNVVGTCVFSTIIR